ncbi:MAG: aminofutalosine synthase MqnE [Gemmatimonadota bacterium]
MSQIVAKRAGVEEGIRIRPQDPDLVPIVEKVEAGERLSFDDGVSLFRTSDLLVVGALADLANRRKNADRVFFVANQHLNPTNVCILNKVCVFCSFGVKPTASEAYTMTLEEAFREAEHARTIGAREFHIVGGLHPKLRLQYYLDLFRGLKERHPTVHVKALTSVEIAHLARIEGMTTLQVLEQMKAAGVDSLPGGGAEVFGPAVRLEIADKKLGAEEWLRIHGEAHALGMPSNCTLLYGHVESYEDRVEHILRLRGLQDETGGFLTYIPLAYHPDHNELGTRLGRQGTATTGFDDLKNLAVGRLLLDNFEHVKTHWIMVTPKVSQVALHFGADDLEGTVVLEKITHAAGAQTPMGLAYDEIVRLIRNAGKQPVERDALYRPIREFD